MPLERPAEVKGHARCPVVVRPAATVVTEAQRRAPAGSPGSGARREGPASQGVSSPAVNSAGAQRAVLPPTSSVTPGPESSGQSRDHACLFVSPRNSPGSARGRAVKGQGTGASPDLHREVQAE